MASFASAGILFYTTSFAALEAGVYIRGLEKLKKYEAERLEARKRYEEERLERRQEEWRKGAAMLQEAQRVSETVEDAEIMFEELISQDS